MEEPTEDTEGRSALPAGNGHAVLVLSLQNELPGQYWQVLSATAVYGGFGHHPGGQSLVGRQEVDPDVGLKVFSAQPVHALLPMLFLYVPGKQLLQGPPSGPVEPGLHEQFTV